MNRIKYYIWAVRWLWKNREWETTRQKWKRMEKEWRKEVRNED